MYATMTEIPGKKCNSPIFWVSNERSNINKLIPYPSQGLTFSTLRYRKKDFDSLKALTQFNHRTTFLKRFFNDFLFFLIRNENKKKKFSFLKTSTMPSLVSDNEKDAMQVFTLIFLNKSILYNFHYFQFVSLLCSRCQFRRIFKCFFHYSNTSTRRFCYPLLVKK